MIINLLTQKKWNLGGSGFNSPPTSSTFADTKFNDGSLKNYNITTNTLYAEWIFSSFERNKLSYIEFDPTGTAGLTIISYSIDGKNWTEFPFKYYKNDTDNTIEVYRLVSTAPTGNIPNQPQQTFVGLTSKSVTSGETLEYIWQQVNPITNAVENICEGLDFVHLKVAVYNVTAPYFINGFRVFIDEAFNDNIIDSEILVLRAQDFFQSRAYEEQPFLKDVNTTFMRMMSTKNPNDFYLKSIGLDTRMFFDTLAEDDNDFSFNAVKYNGTTAKYEVVEEIFNPNNKIFQDLNIRQFALDYKNIADHLENTAASATPDWIQYKKSFVLFLLKHINLFNHLKGTRFLIEYILNLYAKFFGYNILSVVEDKNFVYRISASIPVGEWNSLLKTIVHPCGWNVIYNEIDSSTELQIEVGSLNNLNKRYYKAIAALDCTSYFEGDFYNRTTRIKKLSFLRTSILPDQVLTQTVFGVSGIPTNGPYKFQTKYSESKLNVNLAWESQASVNVDYSSGASGIDPISKELAAMKNYSFENDTLNNTYTAKFGQTGVAIKYKWGTYIANTLVKQEFTPFETYYVDLDELGSRNHRLVLTLSHQDWEQTVFEYRRNYDAFRALPFIFAERNHRYKMMNVFASNNKGAAHSGLAFDSFTTAALQPTTGIVNEISYDASASPAFITEFASAGIIGVTSVAVTANNQITLNLKYKKPGVFFKYTWAIFVGGILQRSIVSRFNELTLTVNNVANTQIYLTVENDYITYTIPTPYPVVA
jgi:hypothetical protein